MITIGAHGVNNATNETFTPVRVASMYAAGDPTPTSSPTTDVGALDVTGRRPSTDE